jgi:hypothetical protein
MRYVIEVAKATAQQKQIEAQAISDYNHAVAASLTPAILEFERIQQLTRLAASPNAKTVLLGGSGTASVMIAAPPPGGALTSSRRLGHERPDEPQRGIGAERQQHDRRHPREPHPRRPCSRVQPRCDDECDECADQKHAVDTAVLALQRECARNLEREPAQ